MTGQGSVIVIRYANKKKIEKYKKDRSNNQKWPKHTNRLSDQTEFLTRVH